MTQMKTQSGEKIVSGAGEITPVRGTISYITEAHSRTTETHNRAAAAQAQRQRLEILNRHLLEMGRKPIDIDAVMTELEENRKRQKNRSLIRKS
jgi:hypothetical protein